MDQATSDLIEQAASAPDAEVFAALSERLHAQAEALPASLEPALFEVLKSLESQYPLATIDVEVPAATLQLRPAFARLPSERRRAFLEQSEWRLFALSLLPGAETSDLLRDALCLGRPFLTRGRSYIVYTSDESFCRALESCDPALLLPVIKDLLAQPPAEWVCYAGTKPIMQHRRKVMVKLLCRINTPETVPALMMALSRENALREIARVGLIVLCQTDAGHRAVVAGLASALTAPRKPERLRAAEVLAAVPDAPFARTVAASALATERVEAVREVLRAIAERKNDIATLRLAPDDIARIRAALIESEGAAWREYAEVGPELLAIAAPWVETVCQNSWQFRHRVLGPWEAMLAFFRDAPEAPRLAMTPFPFLKDGVGWDALHGPTAQTIKALERVFGGDPRLADAICELLDSKVRLPRNALIGWLLAYVPARAVLPLVASLRSPLVMQRQYACEVLSGLPGLPLAELLPLLEASKAPTREAVATLLLGRPDRAAIAALERRLTVERSKTVRTALVAALQACRHV